MLIESCLLHIKYQIYLKLKKELLKLKKELNPVGIFIEDTLCMINRILKLSVKVREVKQNTDFHVCRHTFDPP